MFCKDLGSCEFGCWRTVEIIIKKPHLSNSRFPVHTLVLAVSPRGCNLISFCRHFSYSILSFIEWGGGETRKIPQTKDTLRAKKNGAKRTKKFRTSTQKRKCQQKKISPHSAQLWKRSQRGQLWTWGGRRFSGHQWKNGRDRMTKT